MKYPTNFRRSLANRLPEDIINNIVSYLLQADDRFKTSKDTGYSYVDGVGAMREYERKFNFPRDYDIKFNNKTTTGIIIHKGVSDIEDDYREERKYLVCEFNEMSKIYTAMIFHNCYSWKNEKPTREKKITDFFELVRNVHLFLIKVDNYRALNKQATIFLLEQKGDKLEDDKFEKRSRFNKIGMDIRNQTYEYEKSGKIEDLMKCVEIRMGYEEKQEIMKKAIARHEYNTLILKRAKKGKNQLPLWRPLKLMDGGQAGFSLGVMKKDGTF
jgi:hypothetical protein